MPTPSPQTRALIQRLHDEMRADIPKKKIMGISLLPPPWSQDRIDDLAALLDDAIDARLASVETARFIQPRSRVA